MPDVNILTGAMVPYDMLTLAAVPYFQKNFVRTQKHTQTRNPNDRKMVQS